MLIITDFGVSHGGCIMMLTIITALDPIGDAEDAQS